MSSIIRAKHLWTMLSAVAFINTAHAQYPACQPGSLPAGARLPDIVEQISHLQIQNEHRREMLRFSTTHINIGEGPLQIRGTQAVPCVMVIDGLPTPTQCTVASQEVLNAAGNIVCAHPAGVAFFHPQHNHWHQSDVALFQVHAEDGTPLTAGTKITFCLVDNDQTALVKKGSSRGYFECNAALQGISVGWSDDYHQSTEGQELEITGFPAGTYYLTHKADPENHWLETNENNNFACLKFQLDRQGANPKITVVGEVTMVGTEPCTPMSSGSKSNP